MRRTRPKLVLAILAAGVALFARADAPTDELEHNRRLLEKWKTDPEHYARLRQDLRRFLALPTERREQLRRLDRELYEQNSASHARLRRVLERYADWLGRLPPAERETIEQAEPSRRLQLIRQRREQEWVERLPRATRLELEKLRPQPAAYQARLKTLREEDQKRRQAWQTAIRSWDELNLRNQQLARFRQLQPQIETFLKTSLLPMLSAAEKQRLQHARSAIQTEGDWNPYLSTLVELADAHPIKLPGPTTGPTRYEELPADLKKALPFLKNPGPRVAPVLKKAEGKWPDYAEVVAAVAYRRGVPLPPRWAPSRPAEFAPAVQQFLADQLLPRLNAEEKQRLQGAEGRWPRYPRVLLNLARKYRLEVPGMALPGPRELWAPFRRKEVARAEPLPDVPDHTLREFLRKDLSDAERANLPSFSLADPASREQLKQAYFRRHPRELQRLRQRDQRIETRTKAQGPPG